MFKNGWWEDAYPSSYPPGPAPGHKLQKLSKESGIFQSLGTISFVIFTKKQSQKGHGTMAEVKFGGKLKHKGNSLSESGFVLCIAPPSLSRDRRIKMKKRRPTNDVSLVNWSKYVSPEVQFWITRPP